MNKEILLNMSYGCILLYEDVLFYMEDLEAERNVVQEVKTKGANSQGRTETKTSERIERKDSM